MPRNDFKTYICKIVKPLQLTGAVYILTNKNHAVLYTGVTSNLFARMQQHISKYYKDSFTSKYNVDKLVYYKQYENIELAIAEEKRIKGGSRKKKEILINNMNPDWKYLYQETRFR